MPQDSLSALLDGECTGPELDRLLDALEHSPDLSQQWSRLCMAREARAGTRIGVEQPCICADVMARLDPAPAGADAKVVDLAVHRASVAGARRPRMAAIWKPAIGFAAAASVGAAAVMFLQPQSGGLAVPGGSFEPASLATIGSSDRNLRTVATSDVDQEHAQMLREYLMDHSNAIADEGVGGTLRYARFAAHTAESRSQTDEQP
ncbi:MAG: sigma-E factor negative regulatory protein [Panacagrimonas sp.]